MKYFPNYYAGGVALKTEVESPNPNGDIIGNLFGNTNA